MTKFQQAKMKTNYTAKLPVHEQMQLNDLARLWLNLRQHKHPKLLMARNNVVRYLEKHYWLTFEEMGEVNRTRSWKLIREVMDEYDVPYYRLSRQLAFIFGDTGVMV
jgi:hypothetical protein